MKILFCGSCIPNKYNSKIRYLSAAANQYENSLIEALKRNGHEVRMITYLACPLSGFYEDIQKDFAFSENHFFSKESDGLKGIFSFRKQLKKDLTWADQIITYNMIYVWFGVGKIAKRKKVKSTLILADHTPVKECKSITQKLIAYLSQLNFHSFDNTILLSEAASAYLKSNQRRCVIPGGLNNREYKDFYPLRDIETIDVLFSGLLSPVTGVDILIKAIGFIENKKMRFFFSGRGSSAEIIEKAAKTDERIEYVGFVSREEYMEYLQKAHILINPRDMNMKQNKNNFPSKVVEYIGTGKPIVSTKFPGWERYVKHITFCDSIPEEIAETLEKEANRINYKYNEEVFYKNRELAKSFEWDSIAEKFLC